jgi:hypothetical protein
MSDIPDPVYPPEIRELIWLGRQHLALRERLATWNITHGTLRLEQILAEHGIETGNQVFLARANHKESSR